MILVAKTCTKCGEAKPLSEYHVARGKLRGRTSQCAKCNNRRGSIRYAAYDAAKKKELRDRARERELANPRHALNINLLTALRYRPCDNPITLDQLADLFVAQEGRCALSGVTMTWGRGKVTATSISLDRIDADGGYTAGNVRLLCHAVNAFRGRMSDSEMIAMARAIVAKADEPLAAEARP
jgi:hypothetical protein